MFRTNYTNLNKKQVEDILAKDTSLVCASKRCSRLSGKKLKIILDKRPVEGPTLDYEFESDTVLSVSESGAEAVKCNYSALSMKEITLFTHMISGTKRGYTVIVNFATRVVTAFEMWFIDHEGTVIDTSKTFLDYGEVGKLGEFINREVQRQYYFGYFEEQGKEPPVTRDSLTQRLENAMIKWDDDRGRSCLITYTSSTFSTYVELGTPDGGDVLAFVSDILLVSDSLYIHCYGEVEFSGRLSVEVIDLFSMKKIGTSFGIDENDSFEHTLYAGSGRYLGRFASFQDFTDKGDKYPTYLTSRLDFSVKGTRSTYRPSVMTKKITVEELEELGKNPLIFSTEKEKEKMMVSSRQMDDTDYCVGKSLTFRGDDGFAIEYIFDSKTQLRHRFEGETEWRSDEYRASQLDEDLIIAGHYRTGSNPPGMIILALDFQNGCATCIDAKIGTKYDVHDVDPVYHFGVLETEGLTPVRIFRHGFTDELLGRAFTWTYSDVSMSMHIYNAPRSYSWTIISDAGPGNPGHRAGGPVWSSPCEYIKLRDDVFIVNWVEQKWEGLMGCAAMNLRIMRDCGFTFSVLHNGNGITVDKLGAISRMAGRVDISGIYSLRSYNTKA